MVDHKDVVTATFFHHHHHRKEVEKNLHQSVANWSYGCLSWIQSTASKVHQNGKCLAVENQMRFILDYEQTFTSVSNMKFFAQTVMQSVSLIASLKIKCGFFQSETWDHWWQMTSSIKFTTSRDSYHQNLSGKWSKMKDQLYNSLNSDGQKQHIFFFHFWSALKLAVLVSMAQYDMKFFPIHFLECTNKLLCKPLLTGHAGLTRDV